MTRATLTPTSKRRLDLDNICPLCNQPVEDDDRLVYIKKRKRRCKHYTFYHERCMINEEEKQQKI